MKRAATLGVGFALLAALAAPASASVLRGASLRAEGGHILSSQSAEWRACFQADAEDRRFWADEWSALEAELLRLQRAANASVGLNASNASAAAAAAPASPPAPAANAPRRHRPSPLAGVKINLEPKSKADLVPALAMLKGLYEDGKERIGKLNAREKTSKARFAEKETAHKATLARIEARFKNHTLSEDFRTNETRDENRLWNYWERVRERQHRQYHTSLKIQHATLNKVKTMMDMYEKTIAGTVDKAQVAKQLAKVSGGALPEVVLLQHTQLATATYCQKALAEVRAARAAALAAGPPPPGPLHGSSWEEA